MDNFTSYTYDPYSIGDFIIREYHKDNKKISNKRLQKLLLCSYLQGLSQNIVLWPYDFYDFYTSMYAPALPVVYANYARYNPKDLLPMLLIEPILNYDIIWCIRDVIEKTKNLSTETLVNNMKRISEENLFCTSFDNIKSIKFETLKKIAKDHAKMQLLYANPKADESQSQPE